MPNKKKIRTRPMPRKLRKQIDAQLDQQLPRSPRTNSTLDVTLPRVSYAEAATILASLRYVEDRINNDHNFRIAFGHMEHFEDVTPLTPKEIDRLCQDINTEPDEPAAHYPTGTLSDQLTEMCFKADTAIRYLRWATEGMRDKGAAGSVRGFIREFANRTAEARLVLRHRRQPGTYCEACGANTTKLTRAPWFNEGYKRLCDECREGAEAAVKDARAGLIPESDATQNDQRAEYFERALAAFRRATESGDEPDDAVITDLLVNLGHYLDRHTPLQTPTFADLLRRASSRYITETEHNGTQFNFEVVDNEHESTRHLAVPVKSYEEEQKFFNQIADRVVELSPTLNIGTWDSGGGITVLQVEDPYAPGIHTDWGTADTNWAGDIQNNDRGDSLAVYTTDIPSTSPDVDAIAHAIVRAHRIPLHTDAGVLYECNHTMQTHYLMGADSPNRCPQDSMQWVKEQEPPVQVVRNLRQRK